MANKDIEGATTHLQALGMNQNDAEMEIHIEQQEGTGVEWSLCLVGGS